MIGRRGDFLEDGLHHFHEGYRAVTEFSTHVHRMLTSVIEDTNTKTIQIDRRKLNLGLECTPSEGSRIYARPATLIEEVGVLVEVGAWWSAPNRAAPLIAYANFASPDAITKDAYSPTTRKVRCELIASKSRIYMPFKGEQRRFGDLGHMWHEILRELDEAGRQLLANGLSPQQGRQPRRSRRFG